MRISEIEIPDTIDGKPTRNSLGKLIHPTVEGIKNFWRWFGDSKVVDSKGRPLVMYHGTPKNIGNPDPSKAVRLPGFWMTPGRKIANAYAAGGVHDAMTYREGANVLSLYVKVENPRVYHPRREPISKAWGEYTEGGFDGFFELQGGGFYSISVPYAKQIKSATGNNGNFSVSSNKITEISGADSGEDYHKDYPSITKIKQNINKILQVSQKEYDDWDEGNIDKYAGGGICHLIADSICSVLFDLGIECSSVSSCHEQHVYVAVKCKEGLFSIDIPYWTYETGGGFSWSKIPDVKFEARDVVFYRVDSDPETFDKYVENW